MALSEGDFVFLSASVPFRAGWVDGARPAEIEEAILSISRAVFARRGRLIFGGHPSVSPLIAAIASEYHPPDPSRPASKRPVVTFQSEYFHGCLPDETSTMHRMGWASIQWTPAVPPEAAGRGCPGKGTSDAGERQESLTLMRTWMLLGPTTPPEVVREHGLKPPRMMIAVGGMEGVRDEAAMFLRQRLEWGISPLPEVYVVKSGGGAAARLVDSDRPWPGQPPSHQDLETLQIARMQGGLSALEDLWGQSRPQDAGAAEPTQLRFQPYAAMAQWLMDRA